MSFAHVPSNDSREHMSFSRKVLLTSSSGERATQLSPRPLGASFFPQSLWHASPIHTGLPFTAHSWVITSHCSTGSLPKQSMIVLICFL